MNSMEINVEAFTNTGAWETTGTRVDGLMTAEEAIKQGNLDFEVGLKDVCLAPDDIPFIGGRSIPGYKASINSSTGHVFGIVSDKYVPIQNREAFDCLDSLVLEGKAKYETVGSVDNGRMVWAQLRLPGEVRIGHTDDVSNKYILGVTDHSGRRALTFLPTMHRLACMNAYRAAVAAAFEDKVNVRHSGDTVAKMDYAQRILALSLDGFNDFEEQANFLATQQADKVWIKEFLDHMLPLEEDKKQPKVKKARATVINLFENAESNNLKGIAGTKWAMTNALTEYSDHYKTARGGDEGRLKSVMWGSGMTFKDKAMKYALEAA